MAKSKFPIGIGGISAIIILIVGGIALFIFQGEVVDFIFGLEERINTITDIDSELPITQDPENDPLDAFADIVKPPDTIEIPKEDLIAIFLENLGILDIETFSVDVQVELTDSNLESDILTSRLFVQPLDPREVIVGVAEGIDPERFFVKTDFSTQTNDAGTKHHKFSGWDIVNDPSKCRTVGGFPFDCPIPVTTTTTQDCIGLREIKTCVQIIGFKNNNDDVGNGSRFHGIAKNIDISDWTKEGSLTVSVDYTCSKFTSRATYFILVQGDTKQIRDLACKEMQHVEIDISDAIGNANTVLIGVGARASNVDHFRIDLKISDVALEGNSVAKRTAIEILDQLSIVQNDQEQRILDLGFIETTLKGITFFEGERVVVNGILETRIDEKTITTHVVTGSGITVNNEIPLRIDGEDVFLFRLQEQFFAEGSFHTFNIILNDFIVIVGTGADQRTFEYHTPFPAYSLEFQVLENLVTAFDQQSRAITVPISDTTFEICGITKSDTVDEILPPVVNIIHNGFTLVTTEPRAGIVGQVGENEEFCSIIPDLPRNTILTFKINDNFYDVDVPSTQTDYFLKCDRINCNSNVGFSE